MIKGTCRKHGELIEDETGFRYASKTSESGYRLKCKICFEERLQSYREANFDIPKPEDIKGFCRKHGTLNNETGFICLDKTLKDGYRIRCKECSNNIRANSYIKNREKNIEKAANWKKNNRERVRELEREYRKNNPEKHKKWQADHYARNRDNISLNTSLKARGLEKDFYERMFNEQEGKCAICRQPEKRMARDGKSITRLCIDHDHDTNAVRALLCSDCNTGIGKLMDSPELLLKAADYLIMHKGWTT
jgi:hypothetical protein